MNDVELSLLKEIADIDGTSSLTGAYNIRKNGQGVERKINDNINIVTKEDKSGIDIIVKDDVKFDFVHIPVIVTESGIKDLVYNDFYCRMWYS